MGTNYYWEGGYHICKMSAGWKVNFRVQPELYESNILSFINYLFNTDKLILTEDFHVVDKVDFLLYVLDKQQDRSHTSIPDCHPDEQGFDWTDMDFS